MLSATFGILLWTQTRWKSYCNILMSIKSLFQPLRLFILICINDIKYLEKETWPLVVECSPKSEQKMRSILLDTRWAVWNTSTWKFLREIIWFWEVVMSSLYTLGTATSLLVKSQIIGDWNEIIDNCQIVKSIELDDKFRLLIFRMQISQHLLLAFAFFLLLKWVQ